MKANHYEIIQIINLQIEEDFDISNRSEKYYYYFILKLNLNIIITNINLSAKLLLLQSHRKAIKYPAV